MSPASGILLGREHLSGSSQEAKKKGGQILTKTFISNLLQRTCFSSFKLVISLQSWIHLRAVNSIHSLHGIHRISKRCLTRFHICFVC